MPSPSLLPSPSPKPSSAAKNIIVSLFAIVGLALGLWLAKTFFVVSIGLSGPLGWLVAVGIGLLAGFIFAAIAFVVFKLVKKENNKQGIACPIPFSPDTGKTDRPYIKTPEQPRPSAEKKPIDNGSSNSVSSKVCSLGM